MALSLWVYTATGYAATVRRGYCARCLTYYTGIAAEVGPCTVCQATVTLPKDLT